MVTLSFPKKLLIIIVIFITSQGFSQLSKIHYIPPLTESGSNSSLPQDHYIYISTPSATAISFTIKPVGLGTTGYITGTVSNATPFSYNIGNGRDTQLFVNVNETSTVKTNKGYIIEAQDVIYVSVRINAGSQAGALVSKGLAALGNTFRIGAYTNQTGRITNINNNTGIITYDENLMSFISVMATEDMTVVNFSDISNNTEVENFNNGTFPLNITLDKGESYVIAMNSYSATYPTNNKDGLIGCLVTSDKPIVVNCGSANGSFHNGGGRDYGIDQIVGLDKVGTEYIFVKGDGLDGWENVLIVAHTDNTSISINGNTTVTTINAGEYYLIEGSQYSTNGNMYVQTSQPVFAYQGVGATTSEANQGMFFVPPLSCETRGNLDNIANIQSIGNTTYTGGITIVTKSSAVVTINNLPISNFSPIGPSPVTGNTNYITYKVLNLSGNISVQSTDELYCAYFNYSGAATSGSFYSGFPSPPEINFDTSFVTLGICIPNVTLEVANMGNFDSIEWFFDDGSGSGFVSTGSTALQYTPAVSGTYKLIGKLNCSGLTLESFEVPVSICPDDIDEDGIPDNIDMDNDNDGILNCTESNGNQNINLSNINGGSIPIGGYTYTGTVSTIGNTATTPLIGLADGTFMSETPAKNGTETSVIYDLNFNKNLNLLFEYASTLGNGLITDDEEFIIRVPNTRTITLLNADNQLLVDSNYDGIYESGVTQISSFEIRFKLNGTSLALGAGTFSFLANGVDSFTYIHKNTSETNSNQATFKISATCVAKDTDLDGIEDALDLDSDNDGIPDFIENTGTLIALSGIDADSNGLDDVYNINTTPLDSDSDGVYDFYDLDSDNDGIYDLEESGSGLPDTNFNGVIDNVLTTMGVNGWDDNAETSPDSNLIGYTLNNLDADTVFSYIDLDSDGDLCSDVIEAGFSDANGDNLLGDNTVTTDSNGKVNNAIGYTLPNSNYLNSAPISITTQPIDTESCELSNTIISLVSSVIDTVQWEQSIDGINWNPIIDNTFYSGSQTVNLNILNTPLSYSSYQYRAFLNLSGNTCGLYSEEIKLTVIPIPVANIAPNMLLCDDDNNGTMPFNLTLQNSAISTTTGMTITYHSSQADADTGNAPITSPFESGNTTIYARVENDLNTTCIATSSFNLEVFDSAFPLSAANITPLQECDDTTVGTDTDGLKTFDLTQRESEILNGQSSTDFTLTYFTDSGYTDQISNPSAFPITTAGGQTIYVRMTNNFYGTCYADTSFDVEVYTLPEVNNPNIYSQCDDLSNDGQAFFNLTLDKIKEEINPNYIIEGLIFTYYEDQTEAENAGVTIPTPEAYQNITLGFTTQTVWIRVENPNGCSRVTPLNIRVNPYSGALALYNPNSIYQCDDGLDVRDGVATFDLTNIQNYISTTIFSTFNVSVHFYESQLDAELETNEILDIANHQNTNSPISQNIWVRVKSDLGNDCLGLEEFPNLLIVEALPIANTVSPQIECDNDAIINDGFYAFDTSLIESTLLNGQSLTNVNINFTYLDTDGVTIINSATLPNPFLTQSQIIIARVTNNNTNDPDGACFDEISIEFKVDLQPIANLVAPQIVCDGDAGDIDDDGVFPFNTSTFESTVLGLQTGMEIYYDYIDENGVLVLDSKTLPNTLISGNQNINIEVINPLNTSCTATTTINLLVNPLPNFTVDSPQIVCTSDPTFSVELDPKEGSIVESFGYEWYFENGTFLSNSPTLMVSTPGKYLVTLTKTDGTGCSRTREIIVDASEKATVTPNDVTIVDISENNSVTINTTNLGRGDYEFALREDGSPFINYQNNPVFNNVKAGFYTIYINDKKGCSFSTLSISVIGHPKYFTPNGDGFNDFWQIKGIGSTFQPNSSVFIFDRYGKLIKQLSVKSDGWDGTFNGAPLPTDDYWFKVLLEDGRLFSGHFTLKR